MRKLLIFIGILTVVRAVLPAAGLYFINRALNDKLGNYRGYIEDFDLSLYRGAYRLQGLRIEKIGASTEAPPFFRAKEIDLAISWTALFHGEIAADLLIEKPRLYLADSGDPEKKQIGTEEPAANWQAARHVIVPLKVQTLQVRDGTVEFVNRDLQEPIPVKIDEANLIVRNIRVHQPKKISPVNLNARLQGHAGLMIEGWMDVLSPKPRWDIDFELKNFRLQTVNKTLRVYVPIDVTKALLSLYGEVVARGERTDGYVKLFLKKADVVAPEQKYLGIKHFFFEILGGFANWFLKNDDSKDVAMLVPFHFKNGEWDIDGSEAFWSAIENKTDELKPRIDRRLSLQKK